ncbi:MAG: NUDIX hydrolase [Candidatus Saccharimonadales bacterium]|nr:NUDIX hydrolase [Candidatus Saccharimonadales bacterium]
MAKSKARRDLAGVLIKGPHGYIMQRRDVKPGLIHPGRISVFGGRVEESDDSPKAAALREVKEETDLDLKIEDLEEAWVTTYQGQSFLADDETVVYHIFLAETDREDVKVFEGSGSYILPLDAKLSEHNIEPIIASGMYFYLKREQEG